MISFRRNRKLSTYLVRAKLSPIEQTVGLNAIENGVKFV